MIDGDLTIEQGIKIKDAFKNKFENK